VESRIGIRGIFFNESRLSDRRTESRLSDRRTQANDIVEFDRQRWEIFLVDNATVHVRQLMVADGRLQIWGMSALQSSKSIRPFLRFFMAKPFPPSLEDWNENDEGTCSIDDGLCLGRRKGYTMP
jgi:hypothetical protein